MNLHTTMPRFGSLLVITMLALSDFRTTAAEPVGNGAPAAAASNDLFRRDNLMAWCIVPFDGVKRSPEPRA